MKLRCARAFSIITLCAVTSCGDPAPTTGGLIVEVVGLPSPVLATVVVTGPAGFSRTVQSTTTLEALPPGEYVVSGALLTTATALYQPVTTSQTVNVTAGQTQSVVFTYQLASGSIMLTAAGLPDGVGPSVAIASGSFLRTVTSAGLISAIPPGDYVVRADTFSAINGDRFGATVVTQSVTITASETPALPPSTRTAASRLTVPTSTCQSRTRPATAESRAATTSRAVGRARIRRRPATCCRPTAGPGWTVAT